MCYSFSASKDQEVCNLCVAEKFFLPTRTWGNRCPPKTERRLLFVSGCNPGVTSGKQRRIYISQCTKKAYRFFILWGEGGFYSISFWSFFFPQIRFLTNKCPAGISSSKSPPALFFSEDLKFLGLGQQINSVHSARQD